MKRLIYASRLVLLLTIGLMTLGIWQAMAFQDVGPGEDDPAQQTPAPLIPEAVSLVDALTASDLPPDGNPYTEGWLSQYHGLYDNLWTSIYEQDLQGSLLSDGTLGTLGPLSIRGTDVRLSNPGFNYNQSSFQVAINPLDNRYALAIGNDYPLTAGVAIYRTINGGQTWSAADAPLGVGASACCDGDVAYAYDGDAYVSVYDISPYQVYVIRSTDNGATWSPPTIAPATTSTMDRPLITVDNGSTSPRRGWVYLTYSFGGDGRQIGGYYSSDHGATWNPTAIISGPSPSNGYQQVSDPYVTPDGTLYVGYQEYENTSLGCTAPVSNWLAKSTNGGVSFTRVMIGGAPIVQGGACPTAQAGRGIFCVNLAGNYFRSRSHPIVSGDPTDPNIVYVVYSGGDMETAYSCAGSNGFHSDILFIKSTDGGATWNPKVKINGDPPGKDQYFPWLDVASNGVVWAGWLDRRADPTNFNHVWWQAYSNDKGQTWHEFPLADSASLPSLVIGDYSGISAKPNLTLGVWWDTRIKAAGDPYTEPLAPPPACSQSLGPWISGTARPVAVYGSAAASDGQYVYVAGGHSLSGPVSQFIRYDPVAQSWAPLADLPTAVDNALAVFGQGKVFVLGGNDSSGNPTNLNHIYDIASNTWSAGLNMPGARQQMAGGYFSGLIFAAGGYSTSAVGSEQVQTWEYGITSDSWTIRPYLPKALAGAGSGLLDGHLYVLGGRNYVDGVLNTVYDYEIATKTWSQRASMPSAVNYPGSAVYNGRIWLMGGGQPFLVGSSQPKSINALAKTQIFDPAHNSWQVGPDQNQARSFQAAAVVGNQIISIGGYSADQVSTVEVATQPPLRILIVSADNHSQENHLKRQLLALQGVGQVDTFDAMSQTPSLATLQLYDLVLVFSNNMWFDPVALGDHLADYLDSGGVVVASTFSWYAGPTAIAGRWMDDDYSPFASTGDTLFSESTLGNYTIGHPLMAGVTALNAFYRNSSTLAPGATAVASWADGALLVATKGHAVGINAYLGDYPLKSGGEFARLIVNAGYWLTRGMEPCSAPVCSAPTVIQGSISSSDPIEFARLFRGSPSSTCALPKDCGGITGIGWFHYDLYPFANNTAANQCVSVTLNPKTCVGAQAIHSSAFLGNFDPNNKCEGYLADIGASPGITAATYSFTVPAWQTYSIVVNETSIGSLCPDYNLVVSAQVCSVVANFKASPTIGFVPLDVSFTNLSSGSFDTYAWDFGDGGTSNVPDPIHLYTLPGIYDVSLTVSGPGGTDNVVFQDYIVVNTHKAYLPLTLGP